MEYNVVDFIKARQNRCQYSAFRLNPAQLAAKAFFMDYNESARTILEQAEEWQMPVEQCIAVLNQGRKLCEGVI